MYTVTEDALLHNGIDAPRIPGSLHAAEHAAIGLLPLVASCDRGDIGGMSTAIGPDGLPSVFVYDGYPGRAGFAERGFRQRRGVGRSGLRRSSALSGPVEDAMCRL
jgi:DEAD/DEAH box helicase domain-containing protein